MKTAEEFLSKDLISRFGEMPQIHNTHYSGEDWIKKMEEFSSLKIKEVINEIIKDVEELKIYSQTKREENNIDRAIEILKQKIKD